jgi:hypothetical protein
LSSRQKLITYYPYYPYFSNNGANTGDKKSHSLDDDGYLVYNEPVTTLDDDGYVVELDTPFTYPKQSHSYHEYISPDHVRCTKLEQAAAFDASYKSCRSCENDNDVAERASSSFKLPSNYYGIEQCPKESNGSAATLANPYHPSETDIPAAPPSDEVSVVDPTILPALLYAAGAQPATVRAHRRCSADRSLLGRQAIRGHLFDSFSTR